MKQSGVLTMKHAKDIKKLFCAIPLSNGKLWIVDLLLTKKILQENNGKKLKG